MFGKISLAFVISMLFVVIWLVLFAVTVTESKPYH